MKQIRLFLLMTLLSLTLFCVTIAYCASLLSSNAAPTRQTLAGAAISQREQDAESFLLCIQDGEVCIRLTDGTHVPTGVKSALLPQSDQRALEQGIPVHSRQALTTLLEDLGA